MKFIADAHIPFLKGLLEQYGEAVYLDGKAFTNESIADADALFIRTVTKINEELLRNTRVKAVFSATIGFDHIDTDYCKRNGIAWFNAPGCNSGSVRQYITSALIEIGRLKGFAPEGKTLGIIGLGNVGKKVAEAAKRLGMRVLKYDPPRELNEGSREFCKLTTIAEEADIITFHTPLVKEGDYPTFHLGDRRFFDSLKRKPVIINSARGPIIETRALKEAIKEGKVSGSIIDCWENEPSIDRELLSMVDIATPHIAGYSADGKGNATRMSLESLSAFFNLNPLSADQVRIPRPTPDIIDLNSFSQQNRIEETLLSTYPILSESNLLKHQPEKFTFFRENYPLRRENQAYTVVNYTPEEKEQLQQWGFKLR
ncbi:MAG: 4-phosphoerythronate dehydrogenase [Dysgonamonadaceae bacterium]